MASERRINSGGFALQSSLTAGVNQMRLPFARRGLRGFGERKKITGVVK
jgi:hypothetical protein